MFFLVENIPAGGSYRRSSCNDPRIYARMACKPDSVQVLPPWMTIHLRCLLPDTFSCQPGPARAKAALGASPRAVPIRHCSWWGLPCRPCCHGRGGLLPHRFTVTCASAGRLFSVALSLGFPRPGVTRHHCLVESGLSSRHERARPNSHPRSSSHPREFGLRR